MSSLITTMRFKYLEAIRSVNPPGRWKILVVDDHSQSLLNSVLKQRDILEENVTSIESITNHRDPQTGFEAIYLLMPTSQNIDRIINDFANGKQQYAAAHLFFIENLSDELFERLSASPAERHLKGFKDLYLNFSPTEAQVFSLKSPELFFSLYSPPRNDNTFKAARTRLEEDLKFTSKIIANVCITLNEFPFIRYYLPSDHPPLGPLKPHAATRPPAPAETGLRWRTNLARGGEARAYESVEGDYATKLLAFYVQDHLEEFKRSSPDFGKPDPTRPRATLIITDRSMDMITPFIHEFTYQAMANDLLPIEDGSKYTYKFQSSIGAYEDMTATLSDADTVWTEVRHMHMREAIDKLMADFNKFLEDNAGFKGEGAANLNDMKDMLASLPQYQEQREKFSLHLNMAQECMAIFEKNKLPLVADVEQTCATGVTAEGKTPKSLVELMVPLLDNRDVINASKVRMIALYIQHRGGVPEEDRRRLYQHARLSLAEQDAVNALTLFGVRITRGPGDKDIKPKIKQKPNNDEEYELSRFKPFLKTIIEDQVANKLDISLFPYVKDSPSLNPLPVHTRAAPSQAGSLRSQKASWHKAGAAKPSDIRQRMLLFMAGGMTYSEVREVYQLSAALNKDIYVGTTHNVTPKHFLDDLKVLELGGVGSRAIPQGISETSGPRSFQAYYDERYYTKDAPAPRSRNAMAPPRDDKRPKASPSASFASTTSSMANTSLEDKDKKKKKGLFRF